MAGDEHTDTIGVRVELLVGQAQAEAEDKLAPRDFNWCIDKGFSSSL